MTTRVIMNTTRPNGSGGQYLANTEYNLPDDLAEIWRGQGICRRIAVRSEQTGAVVSAAAGNFPDSISSNPSLPVMAFPSGPGLEIQDGSDTRSFVTAEVVDGVPTGNFM